MGSDSSEGRRGRPGKRAQAVRITGAQPALSEDVRARTRQYTVVMAVRLICVIVMIVAWQPVRWLAVTALVGGMLIPYFAVVVVNAGRKLRIERLAPVPERERPALEPPSVVPPVQGESEPWSGAREAPLEGRLIAMGRDSLVDD